MILLQATEWPLVISIIALILTLIGATWIISGTIGKKVDKSVFDEHVKENKSDFEKEHLHASLKVGVKLYEHDNEQNKMIMAALKHDIEESKRKNDQLIIMMGTVNESIGIINTNIEWIRNNIKCN